MRINNIKFKNKETEWNIDDISFQRLSLLVGASGVGKSLILHIIIGLQNITNGETKAGWEWDINFENNGINYTWRGEYSLPEKCFSIDSNKSSIEFVNEELKIDGKKIVGRTSDGIIFNNEKTIRLDPSKSVIHLLKEEDLIKPIFEAWNRISIMYVGDNSTHEIAMSPILELIRDSVNDFESIRKIDIPLIEKLYLLYKNKLPQFDTIIDEFKTIFTSVEKVDFEIKYINNNPVPMLRMKETSVRNWIPQLSISSGMYRTLMQIVMIKLAGDGDVILIDEFENSLGVNCIDQVADLVLYPDSKVQFIITSHHPYIINNIPFKNWKIVTRNGSKVSVLNPEELNIGNHSKHDAFMQLIQTDAYKKGIL